MQTVLTLMSTLIFLAAVTLTPLILPYRIFAQNSTTPLDHTANLTFNGTNYSIKYHLDSGYINKIFWFNRAIVVMPSSPSHSTSDTLTIELPKSITEYKNNGETKFYVYEGFINGQQIPFKEMSNSQTSITSAIHFDYSYSIIG